VKNTLAYDRSELITVVKGVKVLAPVPQQQHLKKKRFLE
jgi:hypothetical protein